MKPHLTPRSGLSLVELMISMVILAIGLSTLFDSMITSKRVNDRATNQAKAYEEIQAQIESLQYMPFDSVRRDFKGIAFDVQGLRIPEGAVTCGTVTNLANPNPDDTATAPNPNKFNLSDQVLPLRFRVAWVDENGPAWVETVFVVTNRGF
ncbi:MAG: type II secretion system protein [Planctomycetes bacterium]|nr:type II secretion system protein [Planctomycetota bacterium]